MPNEFEPNNTRGNADKLTYNTYTYGRLNSSLDKDVYKITVYSASQIKIDFDSPLTSINNGFWPEDFEILITNEQGYILNRKIYQVDGTLYAYVDAPGDYYVYVESYNDTSTEQYGIKYTTLSGRWNTGYEPNNSYLVASPISLDTNYFGNLYSGTEKDYYSFVLPSSDNTIEIIFDSPLSQKSNSFFPEDFEIVLYDSNLNLVDKKVLEIDGSLKVSTKSTGKFYIKIDSYNDYTNFTYFLKVKTSNDGSSDGSSSSTTSSTSVLHLTSEGDDGLTTGSSGNDVYEVSLGRDDYDGNGGYDTLYDIPEGSMIIRSVDATGAYTGTVGKKFIFIREKKSDGTLDSDYTVAWEVEGIQYEDSNITKDIDNFKSFGYWNLNQYDIDDVNINNNQTYTLNLNSKYDSFNEGSTITYSFSSSNFKLTDQITKSGNILTFKAGSSGPKETTTVTINATDNSVNTTATASQTFTVTMTDDDYSASTSTRENEPNDLYDIPDPFDPNWNSNNAITSSHFNKDHNKIGNLSSIGDYDRFWVYLDEDERIEFHFKPPTGSKSSYEILFVEERTGEVVTEIIRGDNIVKTYHNGSGEITHILEYIAPTELDPRLVGPQLYHLVIRSGDEENFNSGDYSISINNILNTTTLETRGFPGTAAYEFTEGNSSNETIQGSWRNDEIDGNAGNDILYGNQGYDALNGGFKFEITD